MVHGSSLMPPPESTADESRGGGDLRFPNTSNNWESID